MSTAPARVDAHAKVTGALRYGADRAPHGLAHAAYAVATVAKGRIVRVHTEAAVSIPGVHLVLTRVDAAELRSAGFIWSGGYGFQSLQPLLDDRIAYRGQPIALVVADTLVAATEAARLVTADYTGGEPPTVAIDGPGVEIVGQEQAVPMPMFADTVAGDADTALAAAPVKVDVEVYGPNQHQVPMELIGAVVQWHGDTLVVHESTQNSSALQHGMAHQLGIDPGRVQVISPSVGGGFGQKNSVQPHLGPLAVAARRLGRPVKLVLTRPQTFHQASFRPMSRQRVRLGADASGRLVAAVHEIDQQTSRYDLFPAFYTEVSARLYGIGDFRGRQRQVRTDTQTPGYMRAPFEHMSVFAMETAVDELAHATGQDPVALRLANDTATDPVTGLPFSSRHVAECLERGAARFGWAERKPQPRSHYADGDLVGWGVAIGAYPADLAPAIAKLSATAAGTIVVAVAGHEMGQGIRTAITRLVTDDLGVPAAAVELDLGDTRRAPQHLTAGSWGTATALPAVAAGLAELRARLGLPAAGPVDLRAAVAATGAPRVDVEATTIPPGQPPDIAVERLRTGLPALAGPEYPGFVAFSYIAHFAEVRVELATGRVRVPQVVSVADCGRVASPVTAASQVRGGVVWGIGATLRERSVAEPRYGGFLNATLEEYPIAVNADVHDIDVDFIDEPDPLLNPVGVKGLGEVAFVGVAPAIGNALFHATGVRFRRLPIRIEDVLTHL
ncbi:xanthine dehydrogenase family protein molybdopterin-binding subunit [Dactylosporangium sp. CA-092794]|uniref:xanthine dehydrogenase family protein molybdopterin-binding subunit n=1 Tax=Dactylosporangium sp. CA-092794 TaxID=3239929 RepID=UPI003D9381CE